MEHSVRLSIDDLSRGDHHELLKTKINTKPKYLPKAINSFAELNLKEELLSILEREFTLNQVDKQTTWPLISSDPPADICIQTSLFPKLCYSIAILDKLSKASTSILDTSQSSIEYIVIFPVRELALSYSSMLNIMSQDMTKVCTCVGGSSFLEMENHIKGAKVIVGTVSRILYLVNQNLLDIKKVKMIVLDFLHFTLEYGFGDDLDLLLEGNTKNCQLVACFKEHNTEIQNFCNKYLKDPIRFQSD